VSHPADVCGEALAAASGDEAQAIALGERSGFARFAGSEVHQPTLIENLVVHLRVARDGRIGMATTNRTDADGLSELARRAGAAADSAPPQPAFPGFAGASGPLPEVAGFDPETAALSPEDQARLAEAAIAAANGFGVYGFFTSGQTDVAVCSSRGAAAAQTMTDATAMVVAAGQEASGYAERTAWAAGTLDPVAVASEAVEKAVRTRGAGTIDPGHYRAVLEPYAVAELLLYFAYDSFGALGLLEERSYLAGRLGERIFDPRISIAEDPLDVRGLPKAFDFEGTPKRRVQLVEEGVARGVVWDRLTAARAEGAAESTGSAPPPPLQEYGPVPYSLSIAGGEADSTDELAELVGDGIYVTRLHYLGVVEPREGVITGMTRDGTFRIRGGRVAEPLVNLRFTVSVPEMLQEVPGLGRDVRLLNANDFYGDRYPVGVLAPALATARFHITGTGSGPGL
jgi:predicted Zn-dependent protease